MSDKTEGANRRDFLKFAATATPVAVAAAVAGGTTAEAAPVDPSSETMQDTVHTRAYLESTRF